MGIRLTLAKATSAITTWGLKKLAHRPAATLPGNIALRIDPNVVSELSHKVKKGSVIVVGTNGKTTVTNLIADIIQQSGQSILCNRTGANLKTGVATMLLQGQPADWGVIECDELWLAHVAPDLQPTYVVLLDLFRDQLDRCGEIERIQASISAALQACSNTTLIFNADDPLCAYVASNCNNNKVAFGVSENMNLTQNRVTDATMCQKCSHMFSYEYRQYGQLGAYSCSECGFSRPELDAHANNVHLSADSLSFDISAERDIHIETALTGSYMVYNLLAATATAMLCGCSNFNIQAAIKAFNPKNGRLQKYTVFGRDILLNLAKNPTGFNQNLRIIEADSRTRGVAFFINDQVVDGHDISWIWDIDFEELSNDPNIVVFAGGSRRNDLQVRLKYAGINAMLIDSIDDAFATLNNMAESGNVPGNAPVYVIANYSAMPSVHSRLDELAQGTALKGQVRAIDNPNNINMEASVLSKPVVIMHILPDLLNLYGDGGNVCILQKRLMWRNIPVEVKRVEYGQPINLADADLVFLGGGPDQEQRLATEELLGRRDEFKQYIANGGALLAICGGYQILGRTWLFENEEVEGLSLLGIQTSRPGTSSNRLIGNVALNAPMADMPVVGFENHAGRTHLDEGVKPFGNVISKSGSGNNDSEDSIRADGVLSGRVLGTYLHGVLLAKNPEVADWVLQCALKRHAERTGDEVPNMVSLDDSVEVAANKFMCNKLL